MTLSRSALTAAMTAVLCAGLCAQDITPLTTYVSDQQLPPFTGPGIAITEFGPAVGEPIVNARLDVTFDADGATDAADIQLVFVLPLESGTAVWVVTGADLGFPAAGGVHTASIETDLFDGVVHNPTPLPFTPLDVTVISSTGPLFGNFEQLTFTLEIAPRLEGDVAGVSIANGGEQHLGLNAGPSAGAGLPYLVVGSVAGSAPGFAVNGVHVPLNVDAYLHYTIAHPNGPILHDSFGSLDATGKASAVFDLPHVSAALVGLEVNHAFVVFDTDTGAVLSSSNPVPATLDP